MTKRRKPEVVAISQNGYDCPTCGDKVGFNAKRCKSCGQSVSYAAANEEEEESSVPSSTAVVQPSPAAAAAFLAARRGHRKEAREPLSTRSQLTPIETALPVEICAHLNSLRCEQLHRTLRQLVQRLMLHPLNQNWFNAPVDAEALNLPDYHAIISRPMDLGTIKSRLATFEYADVDAFSRDVRLVFQNAMRYNPKGNVVHSAAVEMLSDFEADLDKAVERAQKQQARTDDHQCGLCQGKQCPLCGDKCLTFETPALLCSGPCAQRVRPGQNYHVTRDGSRLWCHKCYLGLKSVIPPPADVLGAVGAFDERSAPFGAAMSALAAAQQQNNSASSPEQQQQQQQQVQQLGLWYKRDLVKRKFEEDIKEPWVQCDACSRWVHQTCALFNPKTEADVGGGDSSRFVCPLCELQRYVDDAYDADVAAESPAHSETASSSDDDSSLLVKREGDDDESSPSSEDKASKTVTDEASSNDRRRRRGGRRERKPLRLASLGPDTIVLEEDPTARFTRPRPSPWPRPLDDGLAKITKLTETSYEFKLSNGMPSWHAAAAASSRTDKDDEGDVLTAASSGSNKEKQFAMTTPSPARSTRKWWSASALPRTKMTDHLEAAVKRRMRTMGDPQAASMADTVSVRLLSALPQSLRLPNILRRNFANPQGGKLPEVLPFESRAVALFQRTDGVDVSLFSMYVHEFGDAGSEGPSAKRVYIAYVDSVEYFVPRVARTAVYHELLVAYLDWSRRRGFEAAHIWACPPQRGNNFIYWSHPGHQRTPSRERLAEWYKAMIRRAQDTKAVSSVASLYDAYFRCLDEQRRRRAASTSSSSGGSGSHKKGGRPPKNSLRRGWSSSSSSALFPGGVVGAAPPKPVATKTLDKAQAASMAASSSSSLALPPLETPKNSMEDADFFGTSRKSSPTSGSAAKAPKLSFSQEDVPKGGIKRNRSLLSEFDDDEAASGGGAGEEKPLPMCPPCFDGDYFPEEACRLYQAIERRKGLFGNGRTAGNAYSSSLRSAGEATIASQLEQLLKHVSSQPSAYPFLRPVDPVSLNLPDYLNVITQPMDLGTVEQNLVNGTYEYPQALIDDVRLCFRNAQRYNPPAHPVHEAASHLSLSFEKKLQSLLGRLKARLETADARDILKLFPLADSETCQDPAVTLAAAKAAAHAKWFLAQAGHQIDIPKVEHRDSTEDVVLPELLKPTPTENNADETKRHRSARASRVDDDTQHKRRKTTAAATTTAAAPEEASQQKAPQRTTRRRRLRGNELTSEGAGSSEAGAEETTTQVVTPPPTVVDQEQSERPNATPPTLPPLPPRTRTESPPPLPVSNGRSRNSEELPLCPRLPVELAASMHRMKDSLFVLYLQPEAASSVDAAASGAKEEEEAAAAAESKPKPGRKRRIALAPALEAVSPELAASDAAFYSAPRFNTKDSRIVDPDAGVVLSNPLLDSRHTWLEMCQFWKMQFDSLRRAKHSSALLLYHLHNPRAESLRVACSHCARDVRRVRWMCQTCVDYCICRDCARVVSAIHPHPLTPYRITFMRRRTLATPG